MGFLSIGAGSSPQLFRVGAVTSRWAKTRLCVSSYHLKIGIRRWIIVLL